MNEEANSRAALKKDILDKEVEKLSASFVLETGWCYSYDKAFMWFRRRLH